MKHSFTIKTRDYKNQKSYKTTYELNEFKHEFHKPMIKVGRLYIKVAVKLDKDGKLEGILLAEERYAL